MGNLPCARRLSPVNENDIILLLILGVKRVKCPICGNDMQPGGIIANDVVVMWHPQAEFEKKGLRQLAFFDGKAIGQSSVLWGKTKIPNAHYCDKCNKIVGIFDVTN